MKHILIFTALLYSATSFSQNQCADLFSLKNKSEKQSVELGIISQIDALVIERLKIDTGLYVAENQKKQANETFKNSPLCMSHPDAFELRTNRVDLIFC